MLRNAMREAAKNPEQGKDRSEIKKGYYSVRAGKHNIYYRIREARIEIIGRKTKKNPSNLRFTIRKTAMPAPSPMRLPLTPIGQGAPTY